MDTQTVCNACFAKTNVLTVFFSLPPLLSSDRTLFFFLLLLFIFLFIYFGQTCDASNGVASLAPHILALRVFVQYPARNCPSGLPELGCGSTQRFCRWRIFGASSLNRTRFQSPLFLWRFLFKRWCTCSKSQHPVLTLQSVCFLRRLWYSVQVFGPIWLTSHGNTMCQGHHSRLLSNVTARSMVINSQQITTERRKNPLRKRASGASEIARQKCWGDPSSHSWKSQDCVNSYAPSQVFLHWDSNSDLAIGWEQVSTVSPKTKHKLVNCKKGSSKRHSPFPLALKSIFQYVDFILHTLMDHRLRLWWNTVVSFLFCFCWSSSPLWTKLPSPCERRKELKSQMMQALCSLVEKFNALGFRHLTPLKLQRTLHFKYNFKIRILTESKFGIDWVTLSSHRNTMLFAPDIKLISWLEFQLSRPLLPAVTSFCTASLGRALHTLLVHLGLLVSVRHS